MSIFVIITRDFTARQKQRVNTVSGLLALVDQRRAQHRPDPDLRHRRRVVRDRGRLQRRLRRS